MSSVPVITEAHLQACATEPIHRLGRIQSFGMLLVLDEAAHIVACSANAADWGGLPAERLLGREATRLLPAHALAAARAHAEVARAHDEPQHLFGVAWPGRHEAVDVAVHACGALVVIEAEPSVAPEAQPPAVLEAAARAIAGVDDVPALAASAARTVAALTGYDRVMVYRFAADGSGTVIAEALCGGITSYLGLRFPDSDIPAQARALYLRNPSRVIADVADDGVPIASVDGAAPDLSLAGLRSVSPVHRRYLANMGTAASMSISLIVDGRLWGLIACHHLAPRRPSLATRAMAELLGRLYALAIARLEHQRVEDEIDALLQRGRSLAALVDAAGAPAERAAAVTRLAGIFGSTGSVLRVDGRLQAWGQVPPTADVEAILADLDGAAGRPVDAVDSLDARWPGRRRLGPQVAGMLALSLGASWRDALLLFRDEVRRHVVWAGNPAKRLDVAHGRLEPRASFAAWREAVRHHGEPWSLPDIERGARVRARLIELLYAAREQTELEQVRRASRQQALLVRELNHRVRNMLGLVKGLIQQTARGAASAEELSARLHDRVHTLSRAYAQIEKVRWQPAPLAVLLAEETRAFGEAGQISLEGGPVLLEPDAYLAVSMVVHELATNARKYGALSTPGGRLQVRWGIADRELHLDWTELDGPPVQAPSHTGFGTRVVSQALSHQLHGRSQLDYRPEGLHAALSIPRGFVAGTPPPPPATLAAAPGAARGVPRRALVVDDDLVIALMAEAMLLSLGCREVVLAGSQQEALAALDDEPFDIALLDVNLGDHSSEGVARRLAELGIPAVLATGYSDSDELPEPLRRLPRVCKPYTEAELTLAMRASA